MNNSLSNSTNLFKSSKSSVVVSSSSVKATSARSNSASSSDSSNAAKASEKVTPRTIQPLSDRTSVEDVNDTVRNLSIVDKKGNHITVKLQMPGYKEMLDIDDSRSMGTLHDNKPYMQTTSVNFFQHMFSIFHNLEVNNKPTFMNWKFANKHHEAFRWLMDQGNSFLRTKFNAD